MSTVSFPIKATGTKDPQTGEWVFQHTYAEIPQEAFAKFWMMVLPQLCAEPKPDRTK